MHHPCNDARCEYFRRVVAALPFEVTIMIDMNIGVLEMFYKCWTRILGTTGCAHGLVLQDDLLPSRCLDVTLNRLVELLPNESICLLDINSYSVRVAERQGTAWRKLKTSIWGGSVVLPKSWIANMITWCRYALSPSVIHDDKALTWYVRAFDRYFWHTTPSLLQNIGQHSARGHDWTGKRSSHFIGETVDGMSIDWTRGLDSPHVEDVPLSSDFLRFLTDEAKADYDFKRNEWRKDSVSWNLRPPRT